MPIPTYTPGYPPDGSSLGQTKATIRNNLDGTFQTLAVDHVDNNGDPGSNPAGYHTLIHQVTQTSVQTEIKFNQIFSGVPGNLTVDTIPVPLIPSNGDTQLYSLSEAGALYQLTGSQVSTNGYAWMGGMLFQWGRGTIGGSDHETDTVTFPVAYPNNALNVSLTLVAQSGGTSSSDNTLSVTNSSPNKTGFSWIFNGRGGSYPRFFWTAIGN